MNTDPKLLAMTAACALIVSAMNTNPAHAQGMPQSARELIQTMRPMPMPAPGRVASNQSDTNADAYGGVASGKSDSARGMPTVPCDATCDKPAP